MVTKVMTLTDFQMIFLMSRGLNTKEISIRLNKQTSTIETYRTRLLKKAGVKNGCHLMRWAFENKIL